MLLRAMVADASGRDALNGVRRSGSYYSLFNVTLRFSMSLGRQRGSCGFWPPPALHRGTVATESLQETIRLVYALPGCICAVTGMLLLTGTRGCQSQAGAVGRRCAVTGSRHVRPTISSPVSRRNT